ncbi:hypothetical protein [Domibacillus epiphyticus]|uniref:DUF3953 domain-containing protein n=1 Tax=Domibacillus epiphyticus TaxID=1714355 RepID=A0A1V2AA77_9BACI|nr:hypothetical protein [Domibacillus epiphyticus]OMP67898.1 hypothetical protein BTO28_05265 [Domibacillus epiphyticus]
MTSSKFRLIYRTILIIFTLTYGIMAYPDGWSRFAILVAIIAIFMTIEDTMMKKANKQQRIIFVIVFALAFFVTFYYSFLA